MILYEVKVNYQRQTGEDNPGNVREAYLVESMNCSEAERRTIEHIKPFVFGELETPLIKKRQFFEILPSDGENWYEARVEMITVEDDTEKHKPVNMLVQADSISEALRLLNEAVADYDCEVIGIKKSPLLEVMRAELDKKEA